MYNDNQEKPTLTVAQLIEKLENLDPDIPVQYTTWEDSHYGIGTAVYGVTDVCSGGETAEIDLLSKDWIEDTCYDDEEEESEE